MLGASTPPYFNAILEPVQNPGKTLTLAMEGEIFNSAELRRELQGSGCAHQLGNDAELVLRLFELYGEGFADKVNGFFVAAIWDSLDHSATFVNDRLGMHYLYYSLRNDRMIFAPEMKALLCDPTIRKEMNPAAVADFFSFGFVMGDKCFIGDIKLMPPGSIMRYQGGKLLLHTYWNFPFKEDYPKRSTKEYIEELHQVLERAVERQTGQTPRCGLALSGGLDSRLIAGYMGKRVSPLSTFTFGDPPEIDEVRFAERVARIIGSRHHHITYSLDDFAGAFPKTAWLMEGLINTSEYYYLAREIGKHVDVAFCGHGGDTLSGRNIDKAVLKAGTREAIKQIIFRKYIRRVLPANNPQDLFSHRYYRLVKGRAQEDFDLTFSGIQAEIPANVVLHHDMKVATWRQFTRVLDLPRLYVRYRYPFFDYDVLDFFLGLPPRMRFHEIVYRGVLIDKFGGLADIPLPNRRVSIRTERHLRFYYALRNRVGYFLLGKFHKTLRQFAPPECAISYNVEAYRGPLKGLVSSLVLDGNRKRGYFDQQYLERTLADYVNGASNESFLMHKLITFELFHRLFLDVDELAPPAGQLL
jgi:asparagine synthase (glutamine-hydrolysing)